MGGEDFSPISSMSYSMFGAPIVGHQLESKGGEEFSPISFMWYQMWYTSLSLVIASVIAVTSVCQPQSRPPKKKRHRKKRKKRKKIKPWSPFRRRKLPYHLVMRCRPSVFLAVHGGNCVRPVKKNARDIDADANFRKI